MCICKKRRYPGRNSEQSTPRQHLFGGVGPENLGFVKSRSSQRASSLGTCCMPQSLQGWRASPSVLLLGLDAVLSQVVRFSALESIVGIDLEFAPSHPFGNFKSFSTICKLQLNGGLFWYGHHQLVKNRIMELSYGVVMLSRGSICSSGVSLCH